MVTDNTKKIKIRNVGVRESNKQQIKLRFKTTMIKIVMFYCINKKIN